MARSQVNIAGRAPRRRKKKGRRCCSWRERQKDNILGDDVDDEDSSEHDDGEGSGVGVAGGRSADATVTHVRL